MIQLTHILVNDSKTRDELSELYHDNAFEYLPMAKEQSYEELIGSSRFIYLTLRFTKEKAGTDELQIIENCQYLKVLAAANRILRDYGNMDAKSISFKKEMDDNKNGQALIIQILVCSEKEDFSQTELDKLAIKIAESAGIKGLSKDDSDKTKEKPAQNTSPKQKEADIVTEKPIQNKNSDKFDEFDDFFDDDEDEAENETTADSTKSEPEPARVSIPSEELLHKDLAPDHNNFDTVEKSFNQPIEELKEKEDTTAYSLHAEKPAGNYNFDELFSSESSSSQDSKTEEKIEHKEASIITQPAAKDESIIKDIDIEKPFELDNSLLNFLTNFEAKKTVKKSIPQKKEDKNFNLDNKNLNKLLMGKPVSDTNLAPENQMHAETKSETKAVKIPVASPEDIAKQEMILKADSDIPFLNTVDEYYPTVDINNQILYYDAKDVDADVKTVSSKKKIDKLFIQAIRYFTTLEKNRLLRAQVGETTEESFFIEVDNYIKNNISIPFEDIPVLTEKIRRAFFGYYVLTSLMANPEISDIKIHSPHNICVKIGGLQYKVRGLDFIDEADYILFIESLLHRNQVAPCNGVAFFTDTQFNDDYILRFNITLRYLNVSDMPVLHVRKTPKEKLDVEDLIKAGMMPLKVATYLREKVKTSKGIVFAGPSASGKTNALNAFVDEIPYCCAGLCIQESDEIFTKKHPNIMCQHIIKGPDGTIYVGLDELGKNGLVCDIQYFIIGEIKGGEAREFLRACNTGHKCMCTIHTPSAEETIPRFADYIKYGSDYSLEEAERMLKDLEVIVYINNFKIQEIVEIAGYDDKEKHIIYKTIYKAELETKVK